MRAWSAEELEHVERTDNVGLASRRKDGSLRRPVTIWAVRLGVAVYVRSAYGPDNPWYVRARASGFGRLTVAGRDVDIAFEDAGPEVDDVVTAAFEAKYERHPPRTVASVVSADAVRCTLRLVPVGPADERSS